MRKIIGLFLLLAIFVTGCNQGKEQESSQESLSNPPKLTITANKKSITALRGTTSWISFELDSAAPPELVNYQKERLNIKPKSKITLTFEREPDDLKVYIWEGNNQIIQQVKSGTIIAPRQKGLVVYEVYANWQEGSAHYAFSVNVD